MCTLNNIIPIKLEKDTEKIILDKIKSKMISGAALYVSTLRWIENKYGEEVIEEIRQYQLKRNIDRWKEKKSEFKEKNLDVFCKYMENSCAGTHEWKKIVDKKNRKKYKFTRCMWAEVFRSLNAEDIGYWICEADGPATKAFNPKIKFKRTKTLMKGDDCCNHEYILEE